VAGDFIDELERIHLQQSGIRKKYLRQQQLHTIAENFTISARKLIILDYDERWLPFHPVPSQALPSQPLVKAFSGRSERARNNNGNSERRNKEFLDAIFPEQEIVIFCRTRCSQTYRRQMGVNFQTKLQWQTEIVRKMQEVTDQLPDHSLKGKTLRWSGITVTPTNGSLI
jgi:trehalose-6-phosphatase